MMFMEEKSFFEDSNGNKLSAILSNPTNDLSKIVILCHGLNSSKNGSTNTGLKEAFETHKISTFRFDFFAHGESEGQIEDRSVTKFVDGILKAITYLKKLGYKRIGICGTSFGGLSAVIAASQSSDLKVMALKAPGMGQTSRNISNYKDDFEKKIWIKAGESVIIPTLIVHGSEDEDVELRFGEELSRAIKSSKLIIFDGADHRFSKKDDHNKSIKDISEFIAKNL